jgi:hypothetical protein
MTSTTTVHGAEALFSIIFNELAKSRARLRALLEALVESGYVDLATYIRKYETIEANDLRIFLDQLILPREEFKDRYADWLKANLEKFGFERKAGVQIRFDRPPPPAAIEPALKIGVAKKTAKAKARTRR